MSDRQRQLPLFTMRRRCRLRPCGGSVCRSICVLARARSLARMHARMHAQTDRMRAQIHEHARARARAQRYAACADCKRVRPNGTHRRGWLEMTMGEMRVCLCVRTSECAVRSEKRTPRARRYACARVVEGRTHNMLYTHARNLFNWLCWDVSALAAGIPRTNEQRSRCHHGI